MSIRTLLVSAGLLIAVGTASSQPSPKPTSGGAPTSPKPAPPTLVRPYGDWTPTPLVNTPVTSREKSVEELLTELESIRTQKAELERKEKELKAAIGKKLEEQAERLKKLGLAPKGVEGSVSDKIPAPYPLTFDKDSAKKDKDEVVVLLMPQLAPGTKAEFVTADRELASRLARTLPKQANGNSDKKLKVLSPAQLDKFKMANPQWKTMSAGEIGKKLGADFVLEIYLDKMRLYQPGSLDNIYEGRAEVTVNVYEVGATGGDLRDKYPLSFAYPKSGVRDASVMPATEFKKELLDNLTTEIVRMHVDSRSAEPDRVGRIILDGNTKTADRKILDLLELVPGQVFNYPAALYAARDRLEKAGFHGVTVKMTNVGSGFVDLLVKVDESKVDRPSPTGR